MIMLSRVSLRCRASASPGSSAQSFTALTSDVQRHQRSGRQWKMNSRFFATSVTPQFATSTLSGNASCHPSQPNPNSTHRGAAPLASKSRATTTFSFFHHNQQNFQQHTIIHPTQLLQIRHFAGRNDRASTSTETRPPTRKQLKEYHRRKRALEYEKNKHSKPNSKAVHRRAEVKETNERLVEIALEEEELKQQLSAYYDKVDTLQTKIESTPKFQALLQEKKISQEELKTASRHAAKIAADKSDTPHPPLPSWWQDRLTYDWGDALMDDIMGNSSDLTSSPSPYPVHMGNEYGRLRRKVERLVRDGKEEEKFLLEYQKEPGGVLLSPSSSSSPQSKAIGNAISSSSSAISEVSPHFPSTSTSTVSDRLLSDLLRAHRDAHGKRTHPVGLASCLQLLQEVQLPLSTLGPSSYVSLLTCCQSVWEGRKVNELRREHDVPSNEYFWSALVDIYARAGDYRGAEVVLDEMLEESRLEYEHQKSMTKNIEKRIVPISIPPLPAYTSFFSACYKLISRSDVHPSIKSDAANRAWTRWKEMRIHSVAPDVMAYGALLRIFAAQGRPEQAIDLLDEIMMQMMMPVNADGVLNKNGDEVMLRNADGEEDGWYVDREGKTVRVKPTTLLFTSALRAVAKSHETANKLNGGMSKKNRRRESITSYHGRLARKIVVLAEQAEVRQDDGFVSALMLCAAAAGDSSTARAIYLASKVRRLDHLRTCGGKDHLKRLQGLIPEDDRLQLMGGGQVVDNSDAPALTFGGESSNNPALRSIEEEFVDEHQAYERREYGTDTRILTTLLLAHSKAMEAKGLGSMWKGRYNRGYLCHNSLRYLEAYNHPQYENMAIPGLNPSEAGLSSQGWQPEEFDEDGGGKNSKQLRKKYKFNMKQITDDMQGNRKDDQDSFFDGFDPDPEDDWRLQMDREAKFDGGGEEEVVSRDWLHDKLSGSDDRLGQFLPAGDGISTMTYRAGQANQDDFSEASHVNNISADYGNEFDSDSDDDDVDYDEETRHTEMKVHNRKQQRQSGTDREALVQAMAEVTNDLQLAEDLIPKDTDLFGADAADDEGDSDSDEFLDEEDFNKFMEETMRGIDNSPNEEPEKLDKIPGVATNDFATFKAHLKRELVAEGSVQDVDDKEARQLFEMMREYYDEGNSSDSPYDEFLGDDDIGHAENNSRKLVSADSITGTAYEKTQADILQSVSKGLDRSEHEPPVPVMQRIASSIDVPSNTLYADDYIEWANARHEEFSSQANEVAVSSEKRVREAKSSTPIDVALPKQFMSPLIQEDDDAHLNELQQNLPGLPLHRIEKVSDEFARTLGYPSILRLTLAVRENMPEAFSPQCLTRVNLANAKHVMAEAEREGVVDEHLLNGMLRVYANSGRIEPAIRFYDVEYRKHGVTQTTHSDRLLIDMLIKKKRLARALKLKQDIEKDGRSLDLLSYGILVEHFGKTNQLGSAILLIKECINKHGSPPGEKSLKAIRLMCRQQNLTDKIGLENMIGKDPLEWMRRGEELKRVQNKRGKSSDLHYGMNRLIDI